MAEGPPTSRHRLLDPTARISEVLFGLIMALTFTGSLSAAESGREEVRTMLVGALGCNVAWGVVDAVMFLMGVLTERGQNLRAVRRVRAARDEAEGRRRLAEALPEPIAAEIRPEEADVLRGVLARLQEPPGPVRLRRADWLGALGVFLLVVLATFPVVLPFLFMREALPALRVSNAIALGMLFGLGWAFGRAAGYRPWATGLAMVALGSALVGATIALGG